MTLCLFLIKKFGDLFRIFFFASSRFLISCSSNQVASSTNLRKSFVHAETTQHEWTRVEVWTFVRWFESICTRGLSHLEMKIRSFQTLVRRAPFYSRLMSTAPSEHVKGVVESTIIEKIQSALSPVYLEVMNESHKHNVPKGSETHFKVVVVSSQFEGKKLIECHRLVNHILKDELANGVHALSIKPIVPAAFDINTTVIEPSPQCLGGSKK